MTLSLVIFFFGALAIAALPEILYDRRPVQLVGRRAPAEARRAVLLRETAHPQWMTYAPSGAA